MTLELQETLEREMDDALRIEDSARRCEAVQTVQSHMLRALVDCQRKTAERVKELVAEKTANKLRIEGAKMLIALVKYASSAGLGGFVYYLITNSPK